MCSYHYTCHPFQFHFTNLIMLTQPFYKSFRKMLICRLRSTFEKGAVLRQPLLIFFSCVLFLFPILQRHIRYVMPHILVRRADDLSFVYQFLDPVC